jgi:hypothetical protein
VKPTTRVRIRGDVVPIPVFVFPGRLRDPPHCGHLRKLVVALKQVQEVQSQFNQSSYGLQTMSQGHNISERLSAIETESTQIMQPQAPTGELPKPSEYRY